MTIGILLAAGNSTRFNGRHSKQLTKLGDQKVLEYSLKVFDSHSEINEIVVVTQSDLIRIVTDLVNDSFPKVTKVIKGGEYCYYMYFWPESYEERFNCLAQ